MKGKILFEKKELDLAKNWFVKAFDESKGHCFGSTDKKYLDFFKSREKE